MNNSFWVNKLYCSIYAEKIQLFLKFVHISLNQIIRTKKVLLPIIFNFLKVPNDFCCKKYYIMSSCLSYAWAIYIPCEFKIIECEFQFSAQYSLLIQKEPFSMLWILWQKLMKNATLCYMTYSSNQTPNPETTNSDFFSLKNKFVYFQRASKWPFFMK